MSTIARTRIGGHVVADTLQALGAEAVFGLPGVHALGMWEGLRTSSIRTIATRTELCAGFAADGYARSSSQAVPLLLSTGPGALNSLTAIMEAASSHVPVVAISSQIPAHLVGRGRGYLHELPDQLGAFSTLVKDAARATSAEAIPGVLARAWEIALTPPSGPVFVEIPVDLLTDETAVTVPDMLTTAVHRPVAPNVAAAACELAAAQRPVIWAGGGVIRSGAQAEVLALAERLNAPVATTYMGKAAIGDDHRLAAGCGCDEPALQELLGEADVVLAVGTELGAETTGQYELRFDGRLIHVDAAPERIGATYPALGLVGDARATLRALLQEIDDAPSPDGPARVTAVRERIATGLADQGRELELGLLSTIEDVLPADAIAAFDMTILGYWAAPHMRMTAGQQFLYPLGSGTLGYAWPAALGASVAHPDRPVLAVVGDGGLQYAIAELGTAAHERINATLLVIDDEAYGILREYQHEAFGSETAVQLPGKDIAAIAEAYGVPVRRAMPDDLSEHLLWGLQQPGPAAIVLKTRIVAAQPTR